MVPADPVEIEQSGALGGSAVSGDAFSFGTKLAEQLEEVVAEGVNPMGKVGVIGRLVDALAEFLVKESANCRAWWARTGGDYGESEGTAVNGEVEDIEGFESMPSKQGYESGQGEVEDVLVIDGVELEVFDEVAGVREFEDDATGGSDECGEAGDEIVDVGDVGEDVVGENEIGGLAVADKIGGELLGEELVEGGDPGIGSDGGDVGGGFDAEAGDTFGDEVAEEIAIIGGDLDDE